jgi:hypothetical protein
MPQEEQRSPSSSRIVLLEGLRNLQRVVFMSRDNLS